MRVEEYVLGIVCVFLAVHDVLPLLRPRRADPRKQSTSLGKVELLIEKRRGNGAELATYVVEKGKPLVVLIK